jgi:hypothetical protein
MPEDLPAAESIKKIETKERKQIGGTDAPTEKAR